VADGNFSVQVGSLKYCGASPDFYYAKPAPAGILSLKAGSLKNGGPYFLEKPVADGNFSVQVGSLKYGGASVYLFYDCEKPVADGNFSVQVGSLKYYGASAELV
jgi:hypothetical protein